MKRNYKILFCALFLGAGAAPAAAQVTYNYDGLSKNLPWPTWELPTPACYDLGSSEQHKHVLIGSCDGNDGACDGDLPVYNGTSFTNHVTSTPTKYGVKESVQILYPPFSATSISFRKQRGGYAFCDYVRQATGNWYSSSIYPSFPKGASGFNPTNDDFHGLDHLRYSSYQFNENGASQNSSCPFGTADNWANTYLCAVAKNVRFNRMPIIPTSMGSTDHVVSNVIRQVYYGDADANIDYQLSQKVGSGAVRAYCFAPQRGYTSSSYKYSTEDYNMTGTNSPSTASTVVLYDKVWGSEHGAHDYRFKVEDWDKPHIYAGVSVASNASDAFKSRNVRKLNNGVEVFIVVLGGTERDYTASSDNQTNHSHIGGKVMFYGRPRLLRTHVYPAKPSWDERKFKSYYCVSEDNLDLRDYVKMDGFNKNNFPGKFVVTNSSYSGILADSGMTLNFKKLLTNPNSDISETNNIKKEGEEITIRCYPYWTKGSAWSPTMTDVDYSPYMEVSIVVHPMPIMPVVQSAEHVCSSETEFFPNRYGPATSTTEGTGKYECRYSKSNGSWAIRSTLNAAEASAEGHTSASITYTYIQKSTACAVINTYEQPIVKSPDLGGFPVKKSKNIALSREVLCKAEEISLRDYTTLAAGDGIFSGYGVDAATETLSTVEAGLGYTEIFLTKTENGCTSTASTTVRVLDLQEPESAKFVNFPDSICSNATEIYLPDHLSDGGSSGGAFSGTGVTGSYFYPAKAIGTAHPKITYSYGTGSCKVSASTPDKLTLVTPATLTVSSIPVVCTGAEVALSRYVNIKEGEFSGTSVAGSVFYPAVAGVGSHPLSYAVNDGNGCSLQRDFTVLVSDLLDESITFGEIPEQCSGDAGYIDLRFYVKNHTGGTFAGPGVDNYRFYPGQASSGFNMLSYTLGSGSCRRTLQTEVFVTATPSVTFEKIDRVCDTDPIKLIDYVSPKGGAFSGYGVVDNAFYPTQAGLGTHEITYVDSVGTCAITGKALINVSGLSDNDAAFRTLPEVCITDEGYLDLRGYVVNAPDNGTFTGTGIEGFRYYPAKSKLGYNTITYSFATGNCPKTIRSEVFVRSVPAVSFRSVGTICTRTMIDLTEYVNRKGGTFSGVGVLGNLFYAEQAGIGKHEVTYTVTIDRCPSYAKLTIDVADLQDENVSFYGILPLCKSDSSWYDLRTYVRGHSGGSFTGKGVDGYRFYPAQSTAGYVSMGYEYGSGSCKRTIYMEALVHDKPEVSIAALPTLCEAAATVNLQAYTTPKGGAFSGVGVSSGVFSAAEAGLGRHSISYRYVDSYGCTNSVTRTVDVDDNCAVTVSFGGLPQMCISDEGYYPLQDYVREHSGGTFAGNGVESGRFYPAKARVGFNTLTYTYGTGSCARTLRADVIVNDVSATYPIGIGKACSDAPIMLMDHVNNKGGTFTGNGVVNNVFLPATAGYGVHDIAYSVQLGDCYSRAALQVEVLSVAAAPEFSDFPQLCRSDSAYIDLREYILHYQEGTFSGQGVENYRFYPLRAKDGFNTITYTYGSGSCQRSLKKEIYIAPKPVVTVTPFSRICEADTLPLWPHASPAGGTWSGAGVFDDNLIATEAGVGKHTLTYTVVQNQCGASESAVVEVASLLPKVVIFDSIPAMCAQDLGYIDLQDYVQGHAGGTFAGNGVENGRLYPAKAKEGFNTVIYRYGTGSCAYSVASEIRILPVATTIATAMPKVCTNTPIPLISYVNNKGGSFSGTGVLRDTFFSEAAGLGAHEVTYEVAMGGCISRTTLTVDVMSVAEPPVFDTLSKLCKSDSAYIDLREFVLNYQDGTFSGQGVESYRFYPLRAKDGFNTITYTYGSGTCQRSLKAEVYVTPQPELVIAPFARVCTVDTIPLAAHANLTGGAWSGRGVFGSNFIPEQAGVGTHQLTYTVTQGTCRATGVVSVEVASLLPKRVIFDSIPAMCAQDLGYIELQDYVQGHSGGTFSGNGVENGRLYPAKAKEGFNTITYRYGSGSCAYSVASEIRILPVATTIATAVPKVCTNTPIPLISYVNNKGGSFSGTGVLRDTFFSEAAGLGAHEVTYEVAMGGCISRATLNIDVMSVAEPPVFDTLPKLCKSDSAYIDLREFVLNYQDGTFSGQGVESYRFYPLRAKDGFNTITYTYGSGTCQRSLKAEVYVTPQPELVIAPFARVCMMDTIPLAAHANLTGGAWSGRGVFGSNFISEQAGVGTHQLTYTVTQGTCRATGVVSVEVASLLPKRVIFDGIPNMCAQDLGYIELQDYVQGHSGGTFSGKGVESGRFYPAKAKVGFNTLTYAYGTGSCAMTLSAEVEVTNTSANKVSIQTLPKFCNPDTLKLLQYVSAKGGTWSGAGVVDDSLFYSDLAGVGTHELMYTVNINGCNSYASASISVLSLNRNDIRFKSPLPDFCNTQTEAVDLFTLVENSRDGVFGGKGVEQDRYFYPNKVNAEVSAITYTYGTGTCQQRITTELKIYNAPNRGVIEIDDVVALCGGSVDLGAMVEPKGGVFSGLYVSPAGVFMGDSAPLGETEVIYSVANKGCRLNKSILVKNEPAQHFDFSVNTSEVQEGGKVRFVPERTSMASYTWYFGDGGYSKETSPWHYYYHVDNTFDVRLEVKNSLGCLLTTVKEKLVSVGADAQGHYVSVRGERHYIDKPSISADEMEAVSAATGCETLEVLLFPNPTNDILNISHVECVKEVEIYDLSMTRQLVIDNPGESVSLSSLRQGVYLVALKLVDGGLKVGKILKN